MIRVLAVLIAVLMTASLGASGALAHPNIANVRDYGAVGNGTTDDTAAFQSAINAAQSLGGEVYLPPASPRYVIWSALTYNVSMGPLTIRGSGKYASVVRYTGTGTWLSAIGGNTSIQLTLADFTLQLHGIGGIGVDMSQAVSSTVRSVRIASSIGSANGTGINARPTNSAWAPFFNVLDDVTFDALTSGLVLDSTVGNGPNRWRILALTCLSVTDCIRIGANSTQLVSGTDILGVYCDEQTGACLSLGANADRTTIVGARQETAAGGSLFSINPAANRTVILGYQDHGGLIGSSALGIRGFLTGQWDEGVAWSGATSTIPQRAVRDSDSGIYIDFGPTTFASLGTAGNGRVLYCSDCTKTTPCASGGSGALAKRLNGAWDCN